MEGLSKQNLCQGVCTPHDANINTATSDAMTLRGAVLGQRSASCARKCGITASASSCLCKRQTSILQASLSFQCLKKSSSPALGFVTKVRLNFTSNEMRHGWSLARQRSFSEGLGDSEVRRLRSRSSSPPLQEADAVDTDEVSHPTLESTSGDLLEQTNAQRYGGSCATSCRLMWRDTPLKV